MLPLILPQGEMTWIVLLPVAHAQRAAPTTQADL